MNEKQILNESVKRVRGAVRTEMNIVGDYMLAAILPEVVVAVGEAKAALVSTDWLRDALVGSIDRTALQAAVRDALATAQQKEIEA